MTDFKKLKNLNEDSKIKLNSWGINVPFPMVIRSSSGGGSKQEWNPANKNDSDYIAEEARNCYNSLKSFIQVSPESEYINDANELFAEYKKIFKV